MTDYKLFILNALLLAGLIAGATALQHTQSPHSDAPQPASQNTDTANSAPTAATLRVENVTPSAPTPTPTPKPSIQRRYNEDDD